MKIVLITPPRDYFTPAQSSAIATIYWHCCQEAMREGVEPIVIANAGGGTPYAWDRAILIDHPRLPTTGVAKMRARLKRKVTGWTELDGPASLKRIEIALRAEHLERSCFVISNNPEGAIYLRRKFPRASIVHWFQNQVECKQWARKQYREAVDLSLAVSQYTARWSQEYYDLDDEAIRVIYNSVDAETFCPQAPGSDERAVVEAARPLPTINFIGRTGYEKAPDTLLQAGLVLASKGIPFRLQFVGHHPAQTRDTNSYSYELCELTDQLQARGVPVEWTGYIGRDELPHYLQRASINVVPSRWEEPFGMTILEGMASGLATVVSRVGGIPEVVGDAALMFERNDVYGLAAHLAALLQDQTLRQEYSRRARERALLFPWKRAWTELHNALREATA
jgi:glycosyltransferase involved in cell wall biosynthesis